MISVLSLWGGGANASDVGMGMELFDYWAAIIINNNSIVGMGLEDLAVG